MSRVISLPPLKKQQKQECFGCLYSPISLDEKIPPHKFKHLVGSSLDFQKKSDSKHESIFSRFWEENSIKVMNAQPSTSTAQSKSSFGYNISRLFTHGNSPNRLKTNSDHQRVERSYIKPERIFQGKNKKGRRLKQLSALSSINSSIEVSPQNEDYPKGLVPIKEISFQDKSRDLSLEIMPKNLSPAHKKVLSRFSQKSAKPIKIIKSQVTDQALQTDETIAPFSKTPISASEHSSCYNAFDIDTWEFKNN